MAYVEVDVDLDQFDTDELIEELSNRFLKGRLKKLSDKKLEALKDCTKELIEALGLQKYENTIEVKSLEDELKYEHFTKVFHKYTISQIEQLLPE